MGTVWRGYDAVLDREVAVKLIRSDAIATPEQAAEFAQRFTREARVTARIRHHGVPQVYDAVLDDTVDHVYLVMQLVHGTSLREIIDPDRPLPIAWAAAVTAQICTVLSYAHAVPVVHRDLKPDNVLIAHDGTVTVLDFGIAAILGGDVTRLTSTGSPIGTSQYMSPEQVHGADVGPQSDLYSLGCLLHELLAGRPVFDGDSDFRLMEQHVRAQPRPLRELRPDVPADVEQLVIELLQKAPGRRPADAQAVYDRLLPLLPVPGTPVSDHDPPVPDPTALYRRPNPPRERPSTATQTRIAAPPLAATEVDGHLRAVIDDVVARSDGLLSEERFLQAADIVGLAIDEVGAAIGTNHPEVLELRLRRAVAWFLGDDARRALTELDALAVLFDRRGDIETALRCGAQAAHCRAQLGLVAAALQQFEQVLGQVSARDGDASATALDLRRSVGMLLLAEGRVVDATAALTALHNDLLLVYGPEHEDTREVSEIVAQLGEYLEG
jgi:eukaryotic-like serine/threonine-protein kinase